MELDFDKEIDALLRQSARSGDFVSNQTAAHLDADEISAFAENAVPEKTKQRYMLHLADCDKCRKILSNLILLNAETESETVYAEEKQFVATPVSWYRKLFAFPNLAYTMGALVLVFSGIAAYTVLQNVGDSRNMEVSQTTYDKQPNGKGMSSDGTQSAGESYSSNSAMSANTMMSNTAAMNTSSTMSSGSNSATSLPGLAMPAAPIATANSNSTVLLEEADKNLKNQPKPVSRIKEPIDLAAKTENSVAGAAPPPVSAKENEFQTDGELQKQQPNQTQNSITQNQSQIMPDSRNVQRAPSATLRAESKKRKVEESRDDAAEKLNDKATSVGGKTFTRENNVWYDSAYRGQTTVNVTRGTKEYKKLDSGLRGIAENLGGTAVIVWKQKAYRIQ